MLEHIRESVESLCWFRSCKRKEKPAWSKTDIARPHFWPLSVPWCSWWQQNTSASPADEGPSRDYTVRSKFSRTPNRTPPTRACQGCRYESGDSRRNDSCWQLRNLRRRVLDDRKSLECRCQMGTESLTDPCTKIKSMTFKTFFLVIKTDLLPMRFMVLGGVVSYAGAMSEFSWAATLTKALSKASTIHCSATTSSRRTKLLMSRLTVFTRVITTAWSMVLACSERSVTELMNVPSAYTAAALTYCKINQSTFIYVPWTLKG